MDLKLLCGLGMGAAALTGCSQVQNKQEAKTPQ